MRNRLKTGASIPDWFSYSQVVSILRETNPPRALQGFALFITGYYKSGAHSLAHAIQAVLGQQSARSVTLLLGNKIIDDEEYDPNDISNITMSADERNANLKNIMFVASQIVKAGGAVISTVSLSTENQRKMIKAAIEKYGQCFIIHVNTPLEYCKSKDTSSIHAKMASANQKEMSSIDQPFEESKIAKFKFDLSTTSIDNSVNEVILMLEKEGYFGRF